MGNEFPQSFHSGQQSLFDIISDLMESGIPELEVDFLIRDILISLAEEAETEVGHLVPFTSPLLHRQSLN